MRHQKLLVLVEKFAQQVQQVGPSLWDLFKQLPPPDITKISNIAEGDGTFEIWGSILPGPKMGFNVRSQRLDGFKKFDPTSSEVQRLQGLVNAMTKFLISHYSAKMLSIIKQNVTPDEYASMKAQGNPGEFMLWSLTV